MRWEVFFFTCGLFNDSVSCLVYVALNFRLISKWRNTKDVEGSGCGLIWELHSKLRRVTAENHKYFR
jgi:hypothetical protein